METLQKNIKTLRLLNGMTQQELAKHLNISSDAVSSWERGVNLPTLPDTLAMAVLFGISVDEFLNTVIEKDYYKKGDSNGFK